MILYFTGTGNSKYVANALGHRLNDEVVSLNTIIKYKRTARFRSDKAFVIVAPIYAWRLPRVVEDLLKETEFIGNKNVYFWKIPLCPQLFALVYVLRLNDLHQ